MAALLQSSQAIHPSECDGRAAGALSRGRAESRPRDLTEPVSVLGLPLPRGSLGWGCNLLEEYCCWAVWVGDTGQSEPLLLV